ncbi:MAG: hypothetical protein GY769_14360 [bacterium]|nr:hypothetical protein [bacterium]
MSWRGVIFRAGLTALLLAVSLGGCGARTDRSVGDGATDPSESHLILFLASDCRLNEEGGSLTLPDGSSFVPPLAFDYELRAMVPELARSKRSDLSEDEARLARYVLLLIDDAEDKAAAHGHAASWPCVEDVRESPRVTLP